jgi:hypothetical protein
VIFPSRDLVLLSPLPPAQALAALQAKVQPTPRWRDRLYRNGTGGFTGTAEGGHFYLRRDINYRNSFLPRLQGTIETDRQTGGSRIAVRMELQKPVRIFMGVWLLCVGGFGIPLAIAALTHRLQPPQNDWMGVVMPSFMLVFGLVLPHFGFRPEAAKAQDFLTETLKAQIAAPDADRAA